MDSWRAFVAGIMAAQTCLAVAASSAQASSRQACIDGERVLETGFYAYFSPVSYAADGNPESPGFNDHRGYEADLLTALESMEGAGLSFSRRGIAAWQDIWLKPAGAHYDLVGGGVTILTSRTRNAAGEIAIGFTSGHIAFRQSLLTRAEDAARLSSYDALTDEVRVGVLAGTTGEFRLLELTGIADAAGNLAAGVRVETPRGVLTADGSADYVINAAAASPALAGRLHLYPPSGTMPQVIYLGDETGEAAILMALRAGRIDAVARGEIGNRNAARASDGAFIVTALDPRVEYGGFALAAREADLAACMDRLIDWLTNGGTIGYAEWSEDAAVFIRRARAWPPGASGSANQ